MGVGKKLPPFWAQKKGGQIKILSIDIYQNYLTIIVITPNRQNKRENLSDVNFNHISSYASCVQPYWLNLVVTIKATR